MSTGIATVIFALVILGLFLLDRDSKARTSGALWVPVLWLALAGSRAVSQWLAAFGWGSAGTATDLVAQYEEGSPIDRLIYTGLLIIGLALLVGRRRQVASLLRANVPIILFVLYCAVSILWSDYQEVAFKRWTKFLGDLVMILVVLTERDPSAAVKQLIARMAFLLIPLSVLFIKYYPDVGRAYNPWVWTPMYSGVATSKNMLGMICLLCGLGSVWRLLALYRSGDDRCRNRQLIAHGAILVMVLWLFNMANSMTSLSCFILASGLLVAIKFSAIARRPKGVHLLVAGMVIGCFATLFLGVGADVVSDTMARNTTTLTDRTDIWGLVLSMAGNPIFGTGFESFWLGDRLRNIWSVVHGINQAHNGYLEVYLNLGWIGLFFLAVVLVRGYRNIVTAMCRNPDVGSLWLAYFSVAVVYNFTEAAFKMMFPVWIFLLLAIVAAAQECAAMVEPSRLGMASPNPSWTNRRPARKQISEEAV